MTMTAAEKIKLQAQLVETEASHREAQNELREMRENMERMEEERAEMMAEVEAQIERALASMAIDVDVDAQSDYSAFSGRPSSRTSSRAYASRRNSDAGVKTRLPSIGTESTLAESYTERDIQDETSINAGIRQNGTIDEEEEEPVSPTKKKRFSASFEESPQDNMTAMDEGISQKSDNIAKKVQEIQAKLDAALAKDAHSNVEAWKNQVESQGSDIEDDTIHSRPRHKKKPKSSSGLSSKSSTSARRRKRSETQSSSQTGRSIPARRSEDVAPSSPPLTPRNIPIIPSEVDIPGSLAVDAHHTAPSTSSRRQSMFLAKASSPTTPSMDDSDTEFQSAYSRSSRGSDGSVRSRSSRRWSSDADGEESAPSINHLSPEHVNVASSKRSPPDFPNKARNRLSSTATAIFSHAQPSPTYSVATVLAQDP